MADGFSSQVMLCWPSDRKLIDQLNTGVAPDEQFRPTVEHSLTTCDPCHRSVWIGPQQLQLVNSPFVRARKLCLYCAGRAQKILALTPRQVDINPDLSRARRRT